MIAAKRNIVSALAQVAPFNHRIPNRRGLTRQRHPPVDMERLGKQRLRWGCWKPAEIKRYSPQIEAARTLQFGMQAMQNNWVNEQRSALAEIDSRVDELRSRMTPTVSEPVHSHVATKSPFEELRSRRSWILAILLFCNVSALINLTFQVLSWPSTVELSLSDAQVQVYHDTNGKSSYAATVPVKEFPYDVQLKQGLRFDVLVFIAVNLLLILGLTHVFWRESRLRDDHKIGIKDRIGGGGPGN